MPVDLHVHTTASDGSLTPSAVVEAALAVGLRVIAITDHDTTAGVVEATDAARSRGITVLPGVELSVEEPCASDVHVLGLLVDHDDPHLVETLADLRASREARARTMVDMLDEAGHSVDFADVARRAGGGSIGRVHIARALVDSGSVPTVEEAFRLLIGRDAPFHVRKETLSGTRAIAAIHAAGGVAVLAHPGVSGEAALTTLLMAGLDGIEAFHAEHSQRDRQRFAALAERHGLIVTGGSDFHGPGMRSPGIGAGACPDSAVDAVRERARAYRS